MTRDEIKSFFNESEIVESALGHLPYREARPALAALTSMLEIVGGTLPGGYYGTCISCDEVKGIDEMVACGDESLCSICIEVHRKSEAAESSHIKGANNA